MHRNPNDFSEYSNVSQEAGYADPTYYQQESRSAQPVQSLDPYTGYAPSPEQTGDYEYGNVVPSAPEALQAEVPPMQAYQGPSTIDGYTTDAGVEQRDASAHGSADGPKKRKGLAGLGGLAVTIGGLLLKFKGLIFFIKFAPALISAAVSVVVYSLFFGWQFALGLVASLFIHEMGHALVMKLKGIPMGGLIFIPLLGAAVTMRQMPANAKDEAEVGIAGPIAGAIAASACLVLAQLTPNTHTIWAPLAYFGFFINLFNLVPIVPFDGGRVLAAIDRRIWILGFAGLLIYQIWLWLNGNFSIFLLFFIIIAATQLWSRSKVDTPESKAYYDVPVGTRIVLGLVYFGLAVVLVLGMSISHSLMPII
ncbi:MAG: hypothetical protein NVS4B12_15650 [Ktedonobacteraceae bacterium]